MRFIECSKRTISTDALDQATIYNVQYVTKRVGNAELIAQTGLTIDCALADISPIFIGRSGRLRHDSFGGPSVSTLLRDRNDKLDEPALSLRRRILSTKG